MSTQGSIPRSVYDGFQHTLRSILLRTEQDSSLSNIELAQLRMKELASAEAQASAATGHNHPAAERYQIGYEQGKQDALREVAEALGWPEWLGVQQLLDQMERTTPLRKLDSGEVLKSGDGCPDCGWVLEPSETPGATPAVCCNPECNYHPPEGV